MVKVEFQGKKKLIKLSYSHHPDHIQYLSYFTDLTSAKLCNCLYFPRVIQCLYHQIPLKKIFSSQKDSENQGMIQIPTKLCSAMILVLTTIWLFLQLPVLPNQFYMYQTSYLLKNNFKIRKIHLEKYMRCEVFSIVTYIVNSQ